MEIVLGLWFLSTLFLIILIGFLTYMYCFASRRNSDNAFLRKVRSITESTMGFVLITSFLLVMWISILLIKM